MSDLYRSRAPRSSSRRQQQTALPAEITTPVAQAFSSEYQAAAEVNAQAEEQDLIKQQQEAEQERQQINRQSVATAKRVGQQTQMDPLTGAESVKKDTTTGKPVWEAGFIGDPTPDNTGKPVVPFRDPTGRTAQVPLEAINRKVEPTGETFYEFDMTGEDGQAQRVRRPEDKSNPLFKIDEATGQRYRDVADATGSMVRQPLGIDPVAANQARINKRKEAYAKEKEALKFQEDTLQLEMQGEELNLKPLKEKLTEAEKLAKQYAPEAAKDKSRYEQRPDGLYRVDGSFGDLPAIPRKIETPDEIAAANNWLKQKEQADKQLQGIKAEHDPIEQRVRDMEKRRNALAKQALAASKRAQTDMADMEIAAKAGMDLSRPQWKQVLDIAKKDDRFQQIIAAGEAADQGSLLADAIAGAVARHNKSVTDQSVLEDAARAFDYLNAKAPKTMAEESAAAQVEAEQATKTALVDMLASGVRGDKGTVDTTDAAKAVEIATKSLGVQDPENWSLSPDNRGNYNLHHTSDEAPLGWLDTKNKRVMLFPSATVTDAGQQLLEKASADGFPVFHMGSEATGGGVPMTHQELRDYVAKGVEIARSAATPEEKEALLAKENITPTDIREQVMAGRMSVQDGRWLNEKLFEEKELDNSPDGYAKGFADYLTANPAQAKIMDTGTREQKLAVANNYSDARAGQSAGNMFFQHDTMADRRVELAQKVAPIGPIEKKIDQAFALPGKILFPMIGLLGQMPAWAGQEIMKRAGSETEAGRLADEQFGDYQKRIKGYTNKVLTRDDVVESVGEIRQWANRARPGDQPPEELAAKIAKSVFDGYHQLTEESARNLNTSLDTFNVNKDPLLKAMLQRYLTTSDPSAFDQMTAMMVMDTRDRKTTGEVMKYIENPRVASPELVADRATELGLAIQPGAAPRLLELAGALDKAKDEKQYQSIIAQAGKMLGTTTESDTQHVLRAITTQVTDDPDSWWGMLKGGFVAGRQESIIELGSTLAEIGISALTGFAATPEVIAAKVARRTALSAGRAALKRTAVASLDALGDQFKSFAVARNAISKGRLKLGASLRDKADSFAKAGIITENFGVPLTAGQKLKNAAVTVGKTAAASMPIEAGEEAAAAFGDVDPTIQGTIEQMGMGAIGAGLITPIFLGAAATRNVFQARKAENMLGQAKAKWVEKFNERMAKTPGFKPITVADYDVWSGLQDNAAHKEATTEYQAALAEMLAAEKEAAATPVAGPATAAPPTPAATGQGTGQNTPSNEGATTGQTTGQAPVAEAQPTPATTPTAETQTEKFNETPNVETPQEEEPVLAPDSEQNVAPEDMPFSAPARPQTPRQIAAQARLEVAEQNLAGLSQIAFSAADELRAIPEADRPLYTAVAKAKAGSTIYTADEAKALIRQNGANAVTFQQAEILPPDVQGPRNLKTLSELPDAIKVGPALYRLPEGVQIAIPDALTASVVSNAPSLGILLQTSAQAQAAAKPTVSTEYLKQWEQFGTVKSEGGAVAVTSDTRKAHEAAMFALKQAGIKPSKVVTGPKADGKTEYTILFDAPEASRAKPQAKPQQFTITPAKDIIQQVAKANPKIVALLRPTPNANTSRDNGGMWIGKDENSIEIHFETLDTQLAALQARGRIKSAEQAAEHVQAVLDEEIRHIANIEASRRLHKKIAPDEDYTDWRTAYYGKMWRDEFTEDQRNAVMEAYGDTLKGASDYIKALEGLRMVSQVGSKWGKITEAVLFHLEQVLKVLRELVAKPSKAIQEEIENIKAVLAEYGYDTEAVSNDTKAEETPEITIKVKKDKVDEMRTLAFADPQDAAIFQMADKIDSLNKEMKPEDRKKLTAEIAAFADALAAKLTADGTPTTRQQVLGIASKGKNAGPGLIRAYAGRVRTQAIEGNIFEPFTPQTFDSYTKHGNVSAKPADEKKQAVRATRWADNTRTNQRSDDGQRLISKIKRVSKGIGEPTTSAEWTWFRSLAQDAARMQQDTPRSVAEIRAMAEKGETEDPRAAVWWIIDNLMQWPNGRPQNQFDAPADYTNAIAGDFADAEDGAPSRLDEISEMLRDQEQTDISAADLGAAILEDMNAANAPAQKNLDDQLEAEGDEVLAIEQEVEQVTDRLQAQETIKAKAEDRPMKTRDELKKAAQAEVKEARQPKVTNKNTAADAAREASVTQAAQGTQQQKGTPEQRQDAIQRTYGTLAEGIQIINHSPEMPHIMRGRGLLVNIDDKRYVAMPQVAFPSVVVDGMTPRGKRVFPLAGDKSNWVSYINARLNETIPDLDDKTDVYVEPYGGGLTYLQNLSVLKNTKKRIIIYVARYFEPERFAIYSALKERNQPIIDDIRQYLKRGKMYTPKTEKAVWAVRLLNSKLADDSIDEEASPDMANERPRETLSDLRQTALNNLDALIDLISRDNVELKPQNDDAAFAEIAELAESGLKVTLFDDSNYADLPFERTADVYKTTTPEQTAGLQSLGPVRGEVPEEIRSKNAVELAAQKKPTYDAVLGANGTIIATNNMAPELLNPLLADYGQYGQWFGYNHSSQNIKDLEYVHYNGRPVSWQPDRPEYLAIVRTDIENDTTLYGHTLTTGPNAGTRDYGLTGQRRLDDLNRETPADPTRPDDQRTSTGAYESPDRPAPNAISRAFDEARDAARAAKRAKKDVDAGPPLFSSPAALRAEILESQKGYISPKFKGSKAWLTPDGRWINVVEHYELAPPNFWETNKGFDRDLTGEAKAAGFARVVYDRNSGQLISEHDNLTPAQRSELKNTATELFAELVYDRGGLFSAPASIAAGKIEAAFKTVFPHVDVKQYGAGQTGVFAGDARWENYGKNIKTIPGGDDYTGVALRVYNNGNDPFVRVDEMNVASNKRGQGLGIKMLEAIQKGGIPVYHSFDMSDGFWEHVKTTRPELFNRAKGSEDELMSAPAIPLVEPGFYSQLQKVIAEKMPNKADAKTIRGIITNPQTGTPLPDGAVLSDGPGMVQMPTADAQAIVANLDKVQAVRPLNAQEAADYAKAKASISAVPSEPPQNDLSAALQAEWDRYADTGEITHSDLVDLAEGIAKDSNHPAAAALLDAVETYRDEQRYDRSLAGRGDMESAEAAFDSAIQTAIQQAGSDALMASPATANRDAEYMAAVEAGDMATAQRMVDEAAKAAGYNVGPVFHGTTRKKVKFISPSHAMEVQDVAFFTDNEDIAEEYTMPREYGQPVFEDEDGNEIEPGIVVRAFIKLQNPRVVDMGGEVGDAIVMGKEVKAAKANGNDGVEFQNVYDGMADSDNEGTSYAIFESSQSKSADPVTRDQSGAVIPLSERFNPDNKSILYSSPATDKQADMRQALDTMPPIWRDVLESSMNGQDADTIASRLNIPTEAVGNIQRVAEARLRILLDAAAGRLKPSVQPVQDNWYEPPTLKATSGRPDLALSGIPAVTAIDQRRAGPEEVTHAEMQTMANRMFALDLPATERMLKAWMESGGMTIDAESAPDDIKNIVKAANARQAGHMLMTAAAKLMVTRYALAGTNMLETANLIDLYRNTGTEQARALNMRRDPHQSPAERAAMFIQEALLTPPQAVQNEIAKNPGNKAQILKKWVTRAERIKRELIAEGYDIDATFQQFHVEQQLADAVVPESVKPTLEQADPATQRVVRSILEGESWAEAASRAGTPIATAREAYNAFRQGVKDAYQAFKAEFLGASPADQISLLGLPEWTVDANPDAVPVQTEATKALKQHRSRRKTGGEFDLNNPLAVNRVERAVEMRKATAFDKLSEYWRASILTGPQTHIVNIVSGLTYGGYEATVKKLGAGMLADIARMFGMKPDAASLSDIPAMLAATLPAVRQAFIDSIRSFQFESRMFDSYAEGQSPTAKNSNLFKEQYQPALKGTLGTIMRGASFRLMGAADEFVKSFFTRIEVAAQARQIARAQGHKGVALANAISEQMQPGSLAWLRALEHAKKITFQQKLGSTEDTISKLDGLAKIINNTKQGQFGSLPKGIAHFVFPFVDTPTNIFKQAVTISPLGGLLAIVDATQALRRLKQGNKEQATKLYNAARALSDITNQVVAWGAVLAIAEMVKPGDDDDKLPFLTGTIPWRAVSKGEREIAYRTAPPQSIRIGDTWYSYRRLDPFATALAFMVDSIRDLQSGKPADEILPKIGVNMLHNLQDKTFLQGISDFMNAVQDPNRFGTKWATNIATGFMPNLVRQSIRSADDVFRETDLPNDMPFWDVLGRRIGFGVYPVGWDDGMLPRNPLAPLPATDVWGRPASKNTGTGGPHTDTLLRLFSPVDTGDTANVDPLDVRLLRWNMANPDDAFAMTAPTREIKRTINGKPVSVSLSDAEHADLTTRSGQAARQAIGNRYNNRDLTKEDVKQIRQVTDKAHDMFRELAFRKHYKQGP